MKLKPEVKWYVITFIAVLMCIPQEISSFFSNPEPETAVEVGYPALVPVNTSVKDTYPDTIKLYDFPITIMGDGDAQRIMRKHYNNTSLEINR